MEKRPNKVAYVIGQIVGYVLVGSAATCLCGLLIALTVKFLTLIF